MRKYCSLIFNVLGSVLIFGLAVYVGIITAQNPHDAPFGNYFSFLHVFYLLVYVSVSALCYYISDWFLIKREDGLWGKKS